MLIKSDFKYNKTFRSSEKTRWFIKKIFTNIPNTLNFLLGGIYFTSGDGYQNFLVFAPTVNSITLNTIN